MKHLELSQDPQISFVKASWMDRPEPMSNSQATILSSCRGALSGDPKEPILQPWKDGKRQWDLTSQTEKREAGGNVGRRRKHCFKAHKITANRTAQDEHWLLPKLCRFVQILCKFTTQRWQGAVADSLAPEPPVSQPQPPLGNGGAVTLRAARREGRGLPYPSFLPHLPSGGTLPKVRPFKQPLTPGFCLDCQLRDSH